MNVKKDLTQQHSNNNIIQAIVNKFPADFARALSLPLPRGALSLARLRAFATDKWSAFWQKHDADEAFRKLMRDTYCYNRKSTFNFWLNSLELREFLRDNLKNAEVVLIEQDKASAVSLSDVSAALEIAESVEEFIEMVKASIESINENTSTERKAQEKLSLLKEVIVKLLEQYQTGYFSQGFAPSSRGGWEKIRQQPHQHPREAGFPYRNWDENDEDREKNEVDDIAVASKTINKLNPNRVSQSMMSGPGDNYGKMRTLQQRQQARSSIHGGVGIEVEDEDEESIDETTAATYSMYARQPGHHAAGLHQQPSRNSGAYMQGAAVARAGQGPRGWASGIKDDDDYASEPEEIDSPIKRFIKNSIKNTLEDHTIKPFYGKDTTGSSNRLGGYHGNNSFAKGITQIKPTGLSSSEDEDKLKLKDFIYSDDIEDRYDKNSK